MIRSYKAMIDETPGKLAILEMISSEGNHES